MRIKIHRGTNRIGGCITEYESGGMRLFIDFGEQLPDAHYSAEPIEIEGLTYGDISKSILLITHYHGDHVGKITELPENLPIFIGNTAREILSALSTHLEKISETNRLMCKRLKKIHTFKPGKTFSFGKFTITPITVDHSAFDAYAFKISAEGISIFHTGDFRTHGFRSAKIEKLIACYIGKINLIVCEGTNISRPDATNKSEHELQKDFISAFRNNKYNILYLSSTNIDRLFSIYHAALKAGRPFYVDNYQKNIMDIIAEGNDIWTKSPFYRYGKYLPKSLLRHKGSFVIRPKFIDFLSEQGYVLIARATPAFDDMIEKIPHEGCQTYLSTWKGYVNMKLAAYNPALAKSLGPDYKYMHTSGHCDMQSLEKIFTLMSPDAIIPIHTDNPAGFADLFGNHWRVICPNDGQTINITSKAISYE